MMLDTATRPRWEKLGRILQPRSDVSWLAKFTGPSFAVPLENPNLLRIYVTGRDERNRSRIGTIQLDVATLSVTDISAEPVLKLGRRGTFDENGTGYPCLVSSENKWWMFYVGWVPSVLVPFQNDIGLAVSSDGVNFERVSEAPIVPRNNFDSLSLGSVSVVKEESLWRMWYTSFVAWGKDDTDAKHYYHIKYGESTNGIDWLRNDHVALSYKGDGEYVLGKPSVIKIGNQYHMWFCHRGEEYRIGYAVSNDGHSWVRNDERSGIDCSDSGWDSKAVCYPHCFRWQDELLMLYNGNEYGKTGLGLARLKDFKYLSE